MPHMERFSVPDVNRGRQTVSVARSNSSMNRKTETIGDRVRALREAAKLDRVQLATAVGMKKTTLQTLEERAQHTSKALIPLARHFRVRPEWLQTGIGPKFAEPVGVVQTSPVASQFGIPDPEILHEAETLVLNDEVQTGSKYAPRERARQLSAAYARLAAEGGRLSTAENARFVDSVAERIGDGDERRDERVGKRRRTGAGK